jgi:acyl-CoA dehydrogenase
MSRPSATTRTHAHATGSALPMFREEHDAYREAARTFVQREIAPHVEDWEAARDFPKALFRTVGRAGFFGAKFDPRWGGSGPDLLAEVCWIEELARAGSGGVAADLGAHSQLAALYVDRQGTDEQRERWLVPSITGEAVGALGITEPGAGSDVNGITTRARRDGGDWVLDGAKVFITNGAWCDHVVVAAKTDPDADHTGMTLFVVERDMPGFTSRRMKMLGWRTSHTGELHFDGVRVPDANRLGEQGRGFYAIMQNFAWERLMMSLGAVVAADLALEDAIRYAQEREAFGRPVARFQVWRHRFADLATRIASARALTNHALRLTVAAEDAARALAIDSDRQRTQSGAPGGAAPDPAEVLRATAMAKLVTQRLAFEVADECVQVHGGAGYLMEYRAQRHWRDARLGPIGGGTDDIMREINAGTYGL